MEKDGILAGEAFNGSAKRAESGICCVEDYGCTAIHCIEISFPYTATKCRDANFAGAMMNLQFIYRYQRQACSKWHPGRIGIGSVINADIHTDINSIAFVVKFIDDNGAGGQCRKTRCNGGIGQSSIV